MYIPQYSDHKDSTNVIVKDKRLIEACDAALVGGVVVETHEPSMHK